jgi:hypothetical protein
VIKHPKSKNDYCTATTKNRDIINKCIALEKIAENDTEHYVHRWHLINGCTLYQRVF